VNLFVQFFEKLFYRPTFFLKLLSFVFLPLALLYATLAFLRRKFTKKKDFGTPIISIGNISVGGTGKTPFIIAIAKEFEDLYIITRGYGRKSKGLQLVSHNGKILTDVKVSGDEAMLIAQSTNASVIVSKDRELAIEKAKEMGAKVILLDDGFSKVTIKKLEVLLFPQTLKNKFPLPSGPLREFYFCKKYADIVLYEEKDFFRKVNITNPTERMLLVTAIANPQRLDPFLDEKVIAKVYFPDHAYFKKETIISFKKQYKASSILITQKDEVKIDFEIEKSVMKLQLQINPQVIEKIKHYVQSYRAKANMV